jgi:lipopolysaccharide heptosyltransferase II
MRVRRWVEMLRALLKKPYLIIRKILMFLPGLLNRKRTLIDDDIKKILLLRHDRVGDMALSTPLFKALKTRYPGAEITVLASESNSEILQNNQNIDEILIYKGLLDFINKVRKINFDMAMDLFLTHDLKHASMTYLSGAKYRLGFEDSGREIFFNVRCPSALPRKRMIEHLSDLAKAAGADTENREPGIFLSEIEKGWAEGFLSGKGIAESVKIAVHPGSFYPSQRWPAERFGELSKRVIEYSGAAVLIFGDDKEEDLLKTIKNAAGDRAQIFCGLSLRQFMALLNCCSLLICNNSGPLHIASALKIPTVSMTGPTVVPLWLPWGENHIAINKELHCSPCNRASCSEHSCMESITVDEVATTVVRQFEVING